jgi:phosphatidylglycerophosphate synthase
MVARWIRTWYRRYLGPFVRFLAGLGLTPNALTLSSLAILILAGLLLAWGYRAVGGLVLLFGALLDGIDGELARFLGRESALGAFLDSITDHLGDLALHLGLLWWYLQQGARVEPLLLFLSLFGSLLGSQIRSRAGMVGIDTKTVGWATRFERIVVLAAGLLANWVSASLWVLAALNTFSAAQRLVYAFRVARRQPEAVAGARQP